MAIAIRCVTGWQRRYFIVINVLVFEFVQVLSANFYRAVLAEQGQGSFHVPAVAVYREMNRSQGTVTET